MAMLTHNLTYLAVGAVAVVLVAGLVNLFRLGSSDTSQKLMRWRVGLQFLAIVIIMAAVFFSR
ncbi:twin transmembrane helix small protein [Dichotomicrobium thermohalophilum]|uniref:Hypoxia induced protein n=1 Tax=Dichotomicrobium thermohalophilum TaxID=933063 RepID=A0A397Q2B9_9HYPH|nr:twin transmembrane helix small protein [Dichotomicrobium thermohalophilum]RIA55516.1 hypoxia induced protein [Dichotomicrobium thermohalophilum]